MRSQLLLLLPLACLGALAGSSVAAPEAPYLRAPALDEYARHDPQGTTILGSGRYLRPAGRSFPVARWPHGLALRPDGAQAFVASGGVGQTVSGWNRGEPQVTVVAAGERKRRNSGGAAVYTADGKTLYWSGGDDGAVLIVDVAQHQMVAEVSLNVGVAGRPYTDSLHPGHEAKRGRPLALLCRCDQL